MLIAEIGINHHGKIDVAKKLILEAKNTSCDAVKFQYRGKNFYKQIREIGDEILDFELNRTFLTINQIKELKKYAESLNMKFGISVFRYEDCHELEESNLSFDFWKIPSAEACNEILVKYLISKNYELYLSTGGADLEDLDRIYKKEKNKINIMHCIANYPLIIGFQAFESIAALKKQGWKSVGYSSHDEDFEAAIFAMGFGIDSLERHIVLDKNDGGLDSSSSSTPDEFFKISEFFHSRHEMLKKPAQRNQGEILNLQNLGTSLYAKVNLPKNSDVNIKDFDVFAPRKGLSVSEFLSSTKYITKPINAGEVLTKSHFFDQNHRPSFKNSASEYFKHHKIGIPVRTFDFYELSKLFDLSFYEFHLSFSEVDDDELFKFAETLPQNIEYSVHLPDYINAKSIIDIFSKEKEVKHKSIEIIKRVQKFASILAQRSSKPCNIVGSFPYTNETPKDFLHNLYNEISIYESNECKIFPQWLPKIGWYFGGASRIDTFNNIEYIELIEKENLMICLDICHLIMSSNSSNASWRTWLERLLPHTGHMHLADASGTTSEGLKLGCGEFSNTKLSLKKNVPIILEVWQGHLNSGEGFYKDLNKIYEDKIII
jgi:sialic acid synthase SpsE/endonuclease IV